MPLATISLDGLCVVMQAPYSIEETKPEKNWPTKGSVTFSEYSTRYREGLDLVLKKISCEIHSGEKVSVII